MNEDQKDKALEAAYTVNWFIRERWGDPTQQDHALRENVEIIDILTDGDYLGVEEEPKGDPIKKDDGPSLKVALVIGHNARNKGATIGAPINEREFDFNNKVAQLMISKSWRGLEMKRFNRVYSGSYTSEITKVYKSVNEWNPDLVLELHFNGYNGKVGYSFMLHYGKSEISKQFAKIMNDEATAATGFDDKGTKPLSFGDRGYVSVISANAPMVLTEPFFGDFESHCEKIGEIGHSGVADFYLAGLRKSASLLS